QTRRQNMAEIVFSWGGGVIFRTFAPDSGPRLLTPKSLIFPKMKKSRSYAHNYYISDLIDRLPPFLSLYHAWKRRTYTFLRRKYQDLKLHFFASVPVNFSKRIHVSEEEMNDNYFSHFMSTKSLHATPNTILLRSSRPIFELGNYNPDKNNALYLFILSAFSPSKSSVKPAWFPYGLTVRILMIYMWFTVSRNCFLTEVCVYTVKRLPFYLHYIRVSNWPACRCRNTCIKAMLNKKYGLKDAFLYESPGLEARSRFDLVMTCAFLPLSNPLWRKNNTHGLPLEAVFTRAKCFPNPCQNGGSCTAFSSSYECSCPVGFKGHSCEVPHFTRPSVTTGGKINQINFVYTPSDLTVSKRIGTSNRIEIQFRTFNHLSCPDSFVKLEMNKWISILQLVPGLFRVSRSPERNQCIPNPCKNGGNCYDDEDNYKCTCVRGYTGYNCEEISKCLPNPCKNGATCLETAESYQCECAEHYNGVHCEVHDYCGQNDPCLNGGHCHNKESGYECKGMLAFEPQAAKVTLCGHGYRGITCEEKIPPCDLEPCKNGEHWKGTHCDDPVHTPCSDSPCVNGGKCLALDYGDYKCQCPHDFGGMHCEVLSRCHPNPCYNGGMCHDHASDYECICADGFMGKTCQEPKPCLASPCLNGGDLIVNFLEKNASFCHPNPCENGGQCLSESTTYICQCPIRYSGQKCQVKQSCIEKSQGLCCIRVRSIELGVLAYHRTNARTGMSDKEQKALVNQAQFSTIKIAVQKSVTIVLSNLRRNHAWGSAQADSPPPPHPLLLNKCTPNPCQNSGTCIPIGTVDFACKCPPQFTGKLCTEAAKSYCHPSPCLNGGICTQSPNGYKCQCVGHYRGTNCQGESVKTRIYPCKGKCQCRVGYSGNGYQCTKKVL
ncbi:neurogenic locus notch homolog 1-like, partial [Paramuricea clavata]